MAQDLLAKLWIMQHLFFHDWTALARTVVIGVLAYATLIVLLRVAGKRSLSKMNAFDFVVTVAMGSTLASILLNKSVSLAQGVVALALLVGMQFVITWSSVRAPWVRRLVTGEPTLLLYRGALLSEALGRTRVAKEEVLAAVRSAGLASPREAEAVVLETDGSFSVVRGESAEDASLAGVSVPQGKTGIRAGTQ